MGIVAADSRRLLDRFHADGESPAFGTWVRVPSLSFTFSPVQCPQQERPGPIRVASAGNGRRPSATGGSWLASSETSSPFAGRRRERQKWNAGSGSAVYHAWTGKADGVADTPTPYRDAIAGITCAHSSSLSCEVISAIHKTRSYNFFGKTLLEGL